VTITDEEVREGSSLADSQVLDSTAEVRAYARAIVTPDEVPSLSVVTDGIRRTAQVAGLAARFGAGLLNKPGSLYFSQPPTFAQARDRHHECAGHFGSPLLQLARLAWGYLHLLIVKPVLNLTEWITESPARFFIALILGAVIWIFV